MWFPVSDLYLAPFPDAYIAIWNRKIALLCLRGSLLFFAVRLPVLAHKALSYFSVKTAWFSLQLFCHSTRVSQTTDTQTTHDNTSRMLICSVQQTKHNLLTFDWLRRCVQCKELTQLNQRLDELDARQQRQLLELIEAVDPARSCPPCPPVLSSHDEPQLQQLEQEESVIPQSPAHSNRYRAYCQQLPNQLEEYSLFRYFQF